MANIAHEFKTAVMWWLVKGQMTAVHSYFRTALDTQRQHANKKTVTYALSQLHMAAQEMMNPVGIPARSPEEFQHNAEWDVLRAKRWANWMGKKVGPDMCDPRSEFPFNTYLKTIAAAADATYHRQAPATNLVLSVAYANLLPMAAYQHTNVLDSAGWPLQSYVFNLSQVWDAAAFYPDHQPRMRAELEAQIRNLNEWKWWPGGDGNPAYSAYRSEIEHLIAPKRR